jgi:hypothetical protein
MYTITGKLLTREWKATLSEVVLRMPIMTAAFLLIFPG